jgi:hypothetical protein
MDRIGLAFACFFRLLFRGRLPEEAAAYLPEPVRPELPPGEPPPLAPAALPAATPAAPARPSSAEAQLRSEGALTLLGLLQREGRLVDFLGESLESYDDAAIGAAVRDIHRGCKKVLMEHLRVEPVMPGHESAPVTVPRGFDPGEVRLVGRPEGEPPFRGTLVHHGWRALELKLPSVSEGVDRRVLAPAEVRVA